MVAGAVMILLTALEHLLHLAIHEEGRVEHSLVVLVVAAVGIPFNLLGLLLFHHHGHGHGHSHGSGNHNLVRNATCLLSSSRCQYSLKLILIFFTFRFCHWHSTHWRTAHFHAVFTLTLTHTPCLTMWLYCTYSCVLTDVGVCRLA